MDRELVVFQTLLNCNTANSAILTKDEGRYEQQLSDIWRGKSLCRIYRIEERGNVQELNCLWFLVHLLGGMMEVAFPTCKIVPERQQVTLRCCQMHL